MSPVPQANKKQMYLAGFKMNGYMVYLSCKHAPHLAVRLLQIEITHGVLDRSLN